MSQRKPLVTQHLENISREALEQYRQIVHKFIRRRQGVYALFRRGHLYYVGLASNLRSRLRQHSGISPVGPTVWARALISPMRRTSRSTSAAMARAQRPI